MILYVRFENPDRNYLDIASEIGNRYGVEGISANMEMLAKTSRLTGALFGFEGTLAAKSLKRSRGKYRATQGG